jgi:hypothetical protein
MIKCLKPGCDGELIEETFEATAGAGGGPEGNKLPTGKEEFKKFKCNKCGHEFFEDEIGRHLADFNTK